MTTQKAGDFTPQADAYARARPGYPAAIVDRLLARAEIGAGAPVAEIGAGTGIFTELLAARGLRVTAVEPNASMRQRAPALDGVVWRAGTFESTGLADASQRWVVAAQAFHWARPEVALPELRRVLAPGGPLTVLWNNRDNDASEVLTWTRAAIERRVPAFDEGYRHRDWPEVLTSTGDFRDPEETHVHHVVTMGRDRYLDLWRSHNLLNTAAGPTKMRGLLAEIEERLAGVDTVDVPYRCRAWTAWAR
jgi:SAM-dependent methyltransferase